jgi:ech hydrogenase subunit D
MRETQPIKVIAVDELLANVEEYHKRGYRLVQISCTKLENNDFEFTYSFDKDFTFENLRIIAPQEAEIPSVSRIYVGAFLYENEINEFFGVNIKGISVDFKGTLYKKKIKYPFNTDNKKT